MANFGDALKRLFSTNVIVRKTSDSGGRDKLTVIDSSKTQAYNQDYFRDKFSRIHQSSLHSMRGRNQNGNFDVLREKLYRDYEQMDDDPIMASALDIYSDECTTRNEQGEIINISTKDDNVREILENLFYDILNVDFNLWPWVRNLCKYGDFFLHLDISEKYGIINVSPLPPLAIDRIENSDPKNPHYVKFSDRQQRNVEYENYEISHFRLLSDQNFVPYGKSMMENGRRIYKQLRLMEDAMIIHRIMRAPSKRVFKIDIGNIPPNEVENYMTQIMNKMKKEPHVNQQTGEYDLRYNIKNMTEDFYLPVRGSNNNTDISELNGLNYDGKEDIEYLRSKLFASLKIPKAYLGYDESLTGKATLAQEDIRFARTIERIQRIVEGELRKIAIIHLFAQGYKDEELSSFSISLNNPSTIYTREQLDLLSSKLSLVRDIRSEKILSEDWIYDNIFDMTEEEMERERDKLLRDMWRRHRFEEIERQGNDPIAEGDENEGEPEDSEFGSNFLNSADNDPADNYSDDNNGEEYDRSDFISWGKEGGRPKDSNRYGKDDYAMGRDPIGVKGRTESVLNKLGLTNLGVDIGGTQLDLLSEDNIFDDQKESE